MPGIFNVFTGSNRAVDANDASADGGPQSTPVALPGSLPPDPRSPSTPMNDYEDNTHLPDPAHASTTHANDTNDISFTQLQRNPSPPPPTAGQKRAMTHKAAHDLLNVKAARTGEAASAPAVTLREPPRPLRPLQRLAAQARMAESQTAESQTAESQTAESQTTESQTAELLTIELLTTDASDTDSQPQPKRRVVERKRSETTRARPATSQSQSTRQTRPLQAEGSLSFSWQVDRQAPSLHHVTSMDNIMSFENVTPQENHNIQPSPINYQNPRTSAPQVQVVSNAVGCPSAPERPHNSHINPPSTHQRRTAYSRDAPHYDSRLHPQLAHQQPESYRERPMQQGDAVQYINPSNPAHAPQQGSRQEARYAAYGPPVACPQQDHPSRQSATSQYVGQPVAYPQQNQLSGPVNQYGGQFNAPPAHQSFQEQQSHHHRQWGHSSIPQQSVQQGQLPTSSGGFHPGGQSNTVLTRDTFQGSSQLPPYAQDTQPRNIQSAAPLQAQDSLEWLPPPPVPTSHRGHFNGTAQTLPPIEEDWDMETSVAERTGKARADGLPSGGLLNVPPVQLQLQILDRMQDLNEFLENQAQDDKRFREEVRRDIRGVQASVAELQAFPANTGPVRTPSRRPRLAMPPQAPHSNSPSQSDPQQQAKDAKGPGHSQLQAAVREHLNEMLGINSLSQLADKFPPLTDDEITDIDMDAPDAIHCTADAFRIDFAHGWKTCHLNREASCVFCTEFLKAVRNGRYSDKQIPRHLLTQKQVAIALNIYMEHCRKRFRFFSKHDAEQVKDLTTTQRKKAATNSRKSTLYTSRVAAVQRRHPLLQKLVKVLNLMVAANMSADETDGEKKHPPEYRIIDAQWMSQELREALRRLDELYREDWAHPGGGTRATSGNAPRVRRSSRGSSYNPPAPKGLAKNCYNCAWLRRLKPYQLADLGIRNEVWDLKIPDDVDAVMEEEEEL